MTSFDAASAAATIQHQTFGHMPDGKPVEIYTLKSSAVEMQVMTYGARVVSLETKDRSGKMGNIALGYVEFSQYLKDNKTYFGVIAGRYANRIANGRFTLDGKTHQITINDGPNALHGGKEGFDVRNWSAREIPSGVEFTLVSPDGDQGFPGTLTARVRYTLHDNKVVIQYSATTDKPTVVNLTNHTYFNLSGDGNGTILGEQLTIDADQFTPVNSTLIPTGELAPVKGTPFDFTSPHTIGERIDDDDEQLKLARGYDDNWVLRGKIGELHPAAQMFDPASGRVLTVETTEPGVQFYSGNFLDGSFNSRTGAKYEKRTGFCLETQHFPDSPNHRNFPSTELRPGQTLHSETTWTFTAR
ncbi:MAG TPA: aldose epimerase family protein [Acidobacteriaceae bacterium]